jgi:hypothetical protein
LGFAKAAEWARRRDARWDEAWELQAGKSEYELKSGWEQMWAVSSAKEWERRV